MLERFGSDPTLLMTVFCSNAGGIKKRTIIKSVQKVKERFAEIVGEDREMCEVVAAIEASMMGAGGNQT